MSLNQHRNGELAKMAQKEILNEKRNQSMQHIVSYSKAESLGFAANRKNNKHISPKDEGSGHFTHSFEFLSYCQSIGILCSYIN